MKISVAVTIEILQKHRAKTWYKSRPSELFKKLLWIVLLYSKPLRCCIIVFWNNNFIRKLLL